jgi:hypothetical protein
VLGCGVAFEVDGLDAQAGEAWSVVVKGEAVEIERMYDLLDALHLPLFPWHASRSSASCASIRPRSPAAASTWSTPQHVRSATEPVVTVDVDRPADLFQLDRATCAALLTTQHIGRLAIGGDQPVVIPVNYRSVDGLITFRTEAGNRAGTSVKEPVVFEVDMFDERTRSGWSVLVRVRFRRAADDAHLCTRGHVDTWTRGRRASATCGWC